MATATEKLICEIVGDVKTWLSSYKVNADKESWQLRFITKKVINYILAETNQSSVPNGLYEVAVEMVIGEYLKRKKATGTLGDFDLSGAESSIKIGDTTVSYGDGTQTDEERLDNLILTLTTPSSSVWARWRRIRW